jgi:hypothetical protein
MKKFSPVMLAQLRSMSIPLVLTTLGLYWKPDPAFQPVKDKTTVRLHVSVGAQVRELLVTGIKWYDTQQKRGGGGAVDLTMHLFNLDFVPAVNLLSEKAETCNGGTTG